VADDEEDEALTWEGARDPSHYETPIVKEAKPAKRPKREAASATVDASDDDETLPAITSSALLITLGILAGVYLLYTVGWVITIQHAGSLATTPLDKIAIAIQEGLAIAAPALWFAAAIYLTRTRRPAIRLLWLVVGVLVLVPWPFVFGITHAR
jgi:hypothetical protein